VIRQQNIKDKTATGVQVRDGQGARFLREEAVLILAQEVVVLVFIHDERDFGRSLGTTEFKRRREDALGIVAHESGNHVGTCLGVRVIEGRVPADRARLVEGRVTVDIFSAGGDLLRVDDVHRVTEAVVGETYGTADIP